MGTITACSLDCPDSCSLEATVEDGKLIALDAAPNGANPATDGWICAKVKHTPQLLHGKDRITTPKRRAGRKGSGEFVDISWEEALDEFAGTDPDGGRCPRLGVRRAVPLQLVGRESRPARAVAVGLGAPGRGPNRHHDLRGDGRRGLGPHLWRPGVGRSAGPATQPVDRGLGRQPQRVAPAPVAGDRGTSACRRDARGRRPAAHTDRRPRRPAPCGAARHRRRVGHGSGRVAAAQRPHRSHLHRRVGRRRRRVPGCVRAVDSGSRRRRVRYRGGRTSSASPRCTARSGRRCCESVGARSATATVDPPAAPCSPCRPWPGSSECRVRASSTRSVGAWATRTTPSAAVLSATRPYPSAGRST